MSILGAFGRSKSAPSGSIARDRLKLVLIHDRTNLSNDAFVRLKLDMVKLISNHLGVNEKDIDFQFSQGSLEGPSSTLSMSADVPVMAMRRLQSQR